MIPYTRACARVLLPKPLSRFWHNLPCALASIWMTPLDGIPSPPLAPSPQPPPPLILLHCLDPLCAPASSVCSGPASQTWQVTSVGTTVAGSTNVQLHPQNPDGSFATNLCLSLGPR